MPNYNPNYVYSPRYGSRYMGNKIPAPAQGTLGMQDPLSAPINYEAGVQAQQPAASVPSTVDGGVPQLAQAAPNGNAYDAYGWTDSTDRDTSVISNLGEFGFRQLAQEDPLGDGYLDTPVTTTTPAPTSDPILAQTGAVPSVPISSSSGTTEVNPPWYGSTDRSAVRFISSDAGLSDVYTGIQRDTGTWTVVDPQNETYSGIMVNRDDKWAPGNFNIAGDGMMAGNDPDGVWMGNDKGYSNSRTQLGYDLGQIPWWMPGGILATGASNLLLNNSETDIPNVGKVLTNAGSFDVGAFSGSDGSPTDISGGATGSNVGINKYGDKVSLGYGYGQMDPAIARAAGFNVGVPITDLSSARGTLGATSGFNSAIADVDMSNMTADEMQSAIANSDLNNIDPQYMTAEQRVDLNRMQQTYEAQEQKEFEEVTSKFNTIGIQPSSDDRKTLQAQLPIAQAAYDKANKYGVDIEGQTLAEAQMTVANAETNYNAAVRDAKKAGVSTSGTTAEIKSRIDKQAQAAIAKNQSQGSSSLTPSERAAIVSSTGKSPVYVGPSVTTSSGSTYKPNFDFDPNDFTANYGSGPSGDVPTINASNVITNSRTGEAITNSRTGKAITNSNTGSSSSGGGGGGCVIATHGVMTGGFTLREKATAELYCIKTFHNTWWGEAFRRGYRYTGMQHINNGTAESVYQEFKDFVKTGRGLKKDWKSKANFYWRIASFIVKGLTVARKEK